MQGVTLYRLPRKVMRKAITRFWKYATRLHTAYVHHHVSLMAAAVSFFALLSVLPLLAVGVAILGWALGDSEEAIHRMVHLIEAYIPTGSASLITKTLLDIRRDRNIFGLVGLLGLLYTASHLFANLTLAFDRIWGVKEGDSWVKRRLTALGVELLTLVLMLSSLVLTSLLTYVQNAPVSVFGFHPDQVPFLWRFAGYLVPLILSVMLFTILYRLLPSREVRWRDALVGGVFAGVVWEVSKSLFALYLTHFNSYSRVYEALGGVAILMIWTYLSSVILLLGAEIAADRGGSPLEKERVSGVHDEVAG